MDNPFLFIPNNIVTIVTTKSKVNTSNFFVVIHNGKTHNNHIYTVFPQYIYLLTMWFINIEIMGIFTFAQYFPIQYLSFFFYFF